MILLRYLGIVFFSLLLARPSFASTDRGFLRNYKAAKKYYRVGEYVAAQAVLEPLMYCEEGNDITPYTWFYYALSAYYQNDFVLATDTFCALADVFPVWEQ